MKCRCRCGQVTNIWRKVPRLFISGHNARLISGKEQARRSKGHVPPNRGKGTRTKYLKMHGQPIHRAVAEKKLGRKLRKGEVVDHKDRNTRNNRPSNIRVFPSQAEHARDNSTKNRKCDLKGCGRKHKSKGLCARHYQQKKDGRVIR